MVSFKQNQMKQFRVHTLTELSIYSDCDNHENTIDDKMISDALIFKYSIEDTRFVNLLITSSDSSENVNTRIRFNVDDMEHLHGWLGILLRNKTESTEIKE